jgi:hypothetical protein
VVEGSEKLFVIFFLALPCKNAELFIVFRVNLASPEFGSGKYFEHSAWR